MTSFRSLVSFLSGRRVSARRQLQSLYRNQAVIEFTPQGDVVFANEPFLALMGYSLDAIKGRHHSMFVDPAERHSGDYAQFWNRLQRGEPFVGRCRRIAGNGGEVWLQANYSPVLDGAGKVVRVVKYAMDISGQVLRDAESQSQLAAVGRAQAVIEFDLQGRILRANRNFLDAMGYRHESDVVGRHHSMFVRPDERQGAAYKAFWQHLARGQFHQGQFERVGREGNTVWIEANYNPVLDQAGQPFGLQQRGPQRGRVGLGDAVDDVLEHGSQGGDGRAQLVAEFATSSRRWRSTEARSSAIRLNAVASSPTSSLLVARTRRL